MSAIMHESNLCWQKMKKNEDSDEDIAAENELNLLKKHAEQRIAILQGEKIEIEDEMEEVIDSSHQLFFKCGSLFFMDSNSAFTDSSGNDEESSGSSQGTRGQTGSHVGSAPNGEGQRGQVKLCPSTYGNPLPARFCTVSN